MRHATFVLLLSAFAASRVEPARAQALASDRTLGAAARAALERTRQANTRDGNTYVGSEICLACHTDKRRWRASRHASAYIRPMPQWTLVPGKGVLASSLGKPTDDFLQGLDFNAISSPFDAYKPGAPKLSVREGVYTITIGAADLPVVAVLQWRAASGAWEQLYCVRVPVAGSASGKTEAVYSSPLRYASDAGWRSYAPEAWWDEGHRPRYGAGATTSDVVAHAESHDRSCVGCHATGVRSIAPNGRGEWVFRGYLAALHAPDDPGLFDWDGDGAPELMNVGCESCHGPGGNHVMGSHEGSEIVNPAKLDAAGANEVCGQCHSVARSAPEGLLGWPYDEVARRSWTPGSGPLASYATDAGVLWPDGKTGKHTRQYPDFTRSSKPAFAAHPVRCGDCHDPHGPTTNASQIVQHRFEPSSGLTIPTRVEDDTLCLSCHAGFGRGSLADFSALTKAQVAAPLANRGPIAAAVSAHAHHPYAPERAMGLSRCTSCHMAATQGRDAAQTRSGHTFEAIPPQKTLRYQAEGGMPSSCALSCHGTLVNVFGIGLDPNPATWTDPADLALATRLLDYLGPDGRWWRVDVGPTKPAAR